MNENNIYIYPVIRTTVSCGPNDFKKKKIIIKEAALSQSFFILTYQEAPKILIQVC